MNDRRRRQLETVIDKIDTLKWEMKEVTKGLEEIKNEEEEYIETMPENLRVGERYERATDALISLEDALDALEMIDFAEVVDYITEAIEA